MRKWSFPIGEEYLEKNIMTQSMGLQLAQNSSEVGVPRQRRRRSGTHEDGVPAAMAAGSKPRRKYHCVVVGGELEISDGYLERWQLAEREDRWGNRIQFRERLRDEDSFLSSKWVETGRHKSDSSMTVRFPKDEFPDPPGVLWIGRDGQPRWLQTGPPKGTRPHPPIEWFRPVPKGELGREEFVAKRDEFFAGLRRLEPKELAALVPAPAPKPEPQWFVVDLPEVAMRNTSWGLAAHEQEGYAPPDARQHFPEGWCCRLVDPQPFWVNGVRFDPDWAYVQFPVHYWGVDQNDGWFCLTDRYRHRDYKVECGMWVPRWLLKPVTAEQAQPLYEGLVAEYAAVLKAAGW